MRIGVIRADIPQPLFVADLEPTSQMDFPVEPVGQTRYLSRPDPVAVDAILSASVAATVLSSPLTFPLNITGLLNTLRVRLSVAVGYTVVTVPIAIYATIEDLAAAVNVGLDAAGFTGTLTAVASATVPNALQLSSETKGAGSYLSVDTVGNGSTFNTPMGWGAGGFTYIIPTAGAIIAATVPVGGPVDVSALTSIPDMYVLDPAVELALKDALTSYFSETTPLKRSVLMGNLAGFADAGWTPDPLRVPALPVGPAIEMVEDDGVTAYTIATPVLIAAAIDTPDPGDLTLTGTNLLNDPGCTGTVFFINPLVLNRKVPYDVIVARGGTVTANQIVIPADTVVAGTTAGTTQVKLYRNDDLSNSVTVS